MSAISIIIITLNESKHIANLLSDLSKQTWQDFEVIVVDSNSDDDTCNIALGFDKQLPTLTVHTMDKRGVALGRNTGASLATYSRLLFLDADVRLPPEFLMISNDLLNKKQLNVAGVYLSSNGLAKRFVMGYKLFNVGLYATQFTFPTAVGACLFSTKSIHQTIGGFDSSVTLCEDCDYVKRASKVTRFRMLPQVFGFDPRRLQQDGTIKTGWKYIHANIHRLFIGEIRRNKIDYQFGHYQENQQNTYQDIPQSLSQRPLQETKSINEHINRASSDYSPLPQHQSHIDLETSLTIEKPT